MLWVHTAWQVLHRMLRLQCAWQATTAPMPLCSCYVLLEGTAQLESQQEPHALWEHTVLVATLPLQYVKQATTVPMHLCSCSVLLDPTAQPESPQEPHAIWAHTVWLLESQSHLFVHRGTTAPMPQHSFCVFWAATVQLGPQCPRGAPSASTTAVQWVPVHHCHVQLASCACPMALLCGAVTAAAV